MPLTTENDLARDADELGMQKGGETSMKYARKDAKAYARAHMKGIWAAALTPFTPSLAIDEDGFRQNIRHWLDDLKIDGLFIAGKQGEFFSMSVEERKRNFELAVEASARPRPDHHVLLGPEHGRGDRSREARPEGRRRLHRRARADPAFLQGAGRDGLRVLPDHRREGRYRHRAVEPSGLRLSDDRRSSATGSPTSRTSSRSSTACRARCMRS